MFVGVERPNSNISAIIRRDKLCEYQKVNEDLYKNYSSDTLRHCVTNLKSMQKLLKCANCWIQNFMDINIMRHNNDKMRQN